MAISIEANYSKKLGLPNFSSHQYSVTIRKEIQDLGTLERESAQLYRLLQDSVDREIQEEGFLGTDQPTQEPGVNRNREFQVLPRAASETWKCSPKQRELIERLIREKKFSREHVDSLAQDRFSLGLPELNKLQASGLIDELIEQSGQKSSSGQRNGNVRPAFNGRSSR